VELLDFNTEYYITLNVGTLKQDVTVIVPHILIFGGLDSGQDSSF
jgi:hypothetical protein